MSSTSAGPHRRLGERRVQPGGDVVDRAAGVQVRGPADRELHALLEHVVDRSPASSTAPWSVARRAGSSTRRRSRPRAGARSAISSSIVCARSRPPWRAADRGGHDLVVDDHDPQVLAARRTPRAARRGRTARRARWRRQLVRVADPDGDALALLAAGGLDHHLAELVEEREVVRRRRWRPARAGPQAGVGEQPAGHALVVAAAHRDAWSAPTATRGCARPAAVLTASSARDSASTTSTVIPRRSASSAMIRA
jgi:hypothetical protein